VSENDKKNPAELAGAYALDALTPEETAEFERFLGTSEEARVEAAELSDTAVALGLATAPVQPPASLKANLMAQLASTPQLPPLETSAQSPNTASAPGAASGDARRQDPALDASVDETSSTHDAPRTGDETDPGSVRAATEDHTASGAPDGSAGAAERRARLRWFQRPAVLAGSAAAALALFFGGLLVGQMLDAGNFEQQQATALANINAAPDAQRASAVTSDGQPATLVWSGELGLSALLIEDLPPLPEGKDYQLWYVNQDGAFSAGTFDSSGDGTVWRVLEGTMRAGDQVGVTVEPDGGSDAPTTDPIVAIQS
jgi:anti-sigma-K factor RskA